MSDPPQPAPPPHPAARFMTAQFIVAMVGLLISAGVLIGAFIHGDNQLILTLSGVVMGQGFGNVMSFYFGSSHTAPPTRQGDA